MEKLLNPNDKEYLKIALLKHEETFRQQVFELHRLYQIQKIIMKDIAKKMRYDQSYMYTSNQAEARQCPDLERPADDFNIVESGGNGRVSEIDDNQGNLELTLGPRSYYKRKIKAVEPGLQSDSGPGFLSSSSTGSNHIKKKTRSSAIEELSIEPNWALEMPSSNQDTKKALSLNMT